MADLTITAASCVPGVGNKLEQGVAGETITAGMAVYKAADGKWMKADADSATALARTATAIACTGSSLNQPIVVQRSGKITLGATLTANTTYYLSNTAGGICPLADVGTGEYLEIIGVAVDTAILDLVLKATGVAN